MNTKLIVYRKGMHSIVVVKPFEVNHELVHITLEYYNFNRFWFTHSITLEPANILLNGNMWR